MSSARIANFFGTTGELQLLNQTIIWPGGTTQIPLGRPACGFDNEFCEEAAKGTVYRANPMDLLARVKSTPPPPPPNSKHVGNQATSMQVCKCDVKKAKFNFAY